MVSYHMTYEEELEYITIYDNESLPHWLEIKPKVYYRDGLPYGLVGTVYNDPDDTNYIASCTSKSELPFTKGMIRDIITLIKTQNICLITDDVYYQEQIRSVLSRYNLRFEYINGVMFSFNIKDK